MNKVLFDLRVTQPLRGDKRHGGGKYGEVILGRIINRKLPVACCYDSSVWINQDIMNLILSNNVELFDLKSNSISQIVKEERIAVFYECSNVDYKRLKDIPCDVIGTFHGLRSLETPMEWYFFRYKLRFKEMLKQLVKILFVNYYHKRAKKKIRPLLKTPNIKIVTVSNHSASSFKTFFPEEKVEIPVFYSASTSLAITSERKYVDKYFLLVSANRSYKNNLRAIMAFDQLFSIGYANDYKVIVTGVKEPQNSFWYKIRNRKRFNFVGFVDERELDQLYHDAYCFIYPTLNEGFGYPPLEAMHYGVPVLSSPLSSIPEVCGGNVMYFNPFSIEEIMNRILQILDPKVHQKFSQLALERYAIIKKKQDEDLDRLIDYIYGSCGEVKENKETM